MQAVEKQTGHRDGKLDSVKVPDGFEYLFEMYWKIRRGQTVTFRDIADFQDVMDTRLDAFEIESIFAMDGAMEGFLAKRMKKPAP